jgi:hypothetical protein
MRAAAKRLAWGAAALLTATVVLELTVRFDDWAQFGVPITAAATSLDDLSVNDSLGFHARPNTQFRQFRITALGFRGPDIPKEALRPPLIVTTGASETFGLYEQPGKEWPQQLADSLSTCSPRPTVLNAAFAGMSLPTVREDFDRRIRHFAPSVVIYYPTPMQYLYEKPPSPAEPRVGPVPELSPFRSRAMPRFRDAIKRSVPEPILDLARRLDTKRAREKGGVTAKAQVEGERLERFDRDLRGLVGRYRQGGVTPVLVVHANRFADTTSVESRRYLTAWERFYPEYTGTAIVRFDAQAAVRTVQVARDSGLAVVDARESLSRHGAAFSDYSHFNSEGSAIVAGAVARSISGLVCRTPSASPLPRSPG